MMTKVIFSVVLALLEIDNISAFLTKLTGFTSTTAGGAYCVSPVSSNYIESGSCSPITLSSGGYNAILSCSSQASNSAWSLGIYYSYDANCGFSPVTSGIASGNGCYYTTSLSYYPVFFSVDCAAASISPTRTPSFRPSIAPSFTVTAAPSQSLAPTNTYAPSTAFTTRYRFYGDSSCSATNIYDEAAVYNQQCFSTFLNQNGVFSYYYGKVGCVGNTLSSSWTVTFFNDSHCAIPSGQALSSSGTTCQSGTLNSKSTNLQVLCSYANTSAPTISPSISPSARVATIIAANTTATTCANPLTASALTLNRCSQVALATGLYLLNVTCQINGDWSMHVYGVSTFGCVTSAFLGQYSGTTGACSQWPYSIFGYGEANYAVYCFEQKSVAPSTSPTTRPTVVPTISPSQSPTTTYVPTAVPTFLPSATINPTSTAVPTIPKPPTRTPVFPPTRSPTTRPTINTQRSLVSLYSSSSCSDDSSSFLASVVMSPSATLCSSTASLQTLSSYAINYQSATLQCTTNTSTSGWTLNFYSGSSCSGPVADAYISSPGGCQCTTSVNNQVSANPLRIVVDCGAGNAASIGTTARVTASCSSSSTSSSGSNTISTQAGIISGIFTGLIFAGGLCILAVWFYHKMHDSSVGVANFSDHNSSLNGALPHATAPIQATIYDPEGDFELPHVTRIEVVDPRALPADVVFVEPQFVQFQSFGASQSVDLEEGEIKQDDVAALRQRPEELSPNRSRYRNKQRSGSNNRANIQAWQDTTSLPQSPPAQRSRSLLQASSTRHSASHNSLRAVSVSTDDGDTPANRPVVLGVARIISQVQQDHTPVNVEDHSDDEAV